MEIDFKNWDWNVVGKVDLAENVFASSLRKDIIARVIRWQQAKARSGNHSTKTISMISGTTRKPWAQKETGRARQGSLRSPQFRGGAVVFGPHPRSYEHKLNKKVRALGCVASLSFKMQEGLFSVLENFEIPFAKTSAFNKWLEQRNFKSVLFVMDDSQESENLFRCIRNVPYCDVIPVRGLNVLDIVKHKNIICDLAALKAIEARFGAVKSATVGKTDKKTEPKVAKAPKAEPKKTAVKSEAKVVAKKPVAKAKTERGAK